MKFQPDKLLRKIEADVVRTINACAVEFHRDVIRSIRKNNGRYQAYKRGGKTHWSSTPGQPPNSDSGALIKGIQITGRADRKTPVAYVRSLENYSNALEYGHNIKPRRARFVLRSAARAGRRRTTTPRMGRVAPRPFWAPMIRAKKQIFRDRIKEAVRKAL